MRPLLLACLAALLCSGCDNIAKGSRIKPLQQSEFFDNSQSARLPPPHSIARGWLNADPLLYAGRNPDGSLATEFPWQINAAVLARGREQFDAICANCHGADGYGNGIIVARGFAQPPSLHSAALLKAPAGHFFNVITNGHGAMFPYAAIVAVNDRWAITAYIRALQRSQNAGVEDVPPGDQASLNKGAAP